MAALAAALLGGCSTDREPPLIEAVEQEAVAEDGLAEAFETFRNELVGNGLDQQFNLGFGPHPGLLTETVTSGGLPAAGSARLSFAEGRVRAELSNVPASGRFDLWFVKNVAGAGRTVRPEAGDQFLRIGTFRGTDTFKSLDVAVGNKVNFDLDMVVVTRAGQQPSASRIAVGSRTLFEKRFFRARAGQTLDPVTGTRAIDLETTDALVARGAHLFFKETFGGNGRTCGTCHRADASLTIDPAFIARLPQSDPLFVAETNPDLARLENPKLLRERGLILENLDGFADPTRKFVMRGIPHTLGLAITNGGANFGFGGPPNQLLGWGGDGAPGRGTLNEFAFGAVIQHFTKNLARRPGTDFRIPTQEELDALEAFQLFTGRQKPTNFGNLRPTDTRARSGSDLFFGSGCTFCHVDLSGSTANFNFDTGVGALTPDLPADDGSGANNFNVPPLAEAADTAPLFHNNGARDIEAAVAFYTTDAFNNSPSGFFRFPFDARQQADVAAFLRVVNAAENIRQVRKRVDFIRRVRSTGNTDLLAVAIADTRDAARVLHQKNLNPRVEAVLRSVEQVLVRARTLPDAQRPAPMRQAIASLDLASQGLFTEVPGGGTGGAGGDADGGMGGVGGSPADGGNTGGAGGFMGTDGGGGMGGSSRSDASGDGPPSSGDGGSSDLGTEDALEPPALDGPARRLDAI